MSAPFRYLPTNGASLPIVVAGALSPLVFFKRLAVPGSDEACISQFVVRIANLEGWAKSVGNAHHRGRGSSAPSSGEARL